MAHAANLAKGSSPSSAFCSPWASSAQRQRLSSTLTGHTLILNCQVVEIRCSHRRRIDEFLQCYRHSSKERWVIPLIDYMKEQMWTNSELVVILGMTVGLRIYYPPSWKTPPPPCWTKWFQKGIDTNPKIDGTAAMCTKLPLRGPTHRDPIHERPCSSWRRHCPSAATLVYPHTNTICGVKNPEF